VRSSRPSALAAFKLITDSNLIGGVNGVGNADKGADQRQPEAISTLMAKAESAFPRNQVSASP